MIPNIYPLVFVVVPCHNDYLHTKVTIGSLLKSTYNNYKIILVDDGSSDDTAINIAKLFPDVYIVKGDGNLWWTGSINVGCKLAINELGAEYLLLLNNDVIVHEEAVANLVEVATQNPNALIGSTVYDIKNPNVVWSAGGLMKWPWPGEIQLGTGNDKYDSLRSVDWSPGMGTLIHKDILLQLNFLDQKNMPQYLSDVDLCLRAKKKGYNILITSNSKLYNNIENTGGLVESNILNWNQVKFIFTNLRSADYLPARLKFIIRHCNWYFLLPALAIKYARLFAYILRRYKWKC